MELLKSRVVVALLLALICGVILAVSATWLVPYVLTARGGG